MDRLTTYINFARLLVERDRRIFMAISVKGLSETVNQARSAIREVREQSAGLRDDTAALVRTIGDLRTQIGAAHDDLKFEAETLKNSDATAGEQSPPSTFRVIGGHDND